jgi:general stress protein YciG
MAGTITGGKKAAAKNLANDPDFYKKIGARGGARGNTGGFAYKEPCGCSLIRDKNHIKAQCAGKLGGLISKRTAKV